VLPVWATNWGSFARSYLVVLGVNLVRREFKPALRKAKLPDVRFHDLRHGFASLLIAQGEHPKLISEQLGHASVKITMDRYGH
jgi:integrase